MPFLLQGNPTRFALRAYLRQPFVYWLLNRYQDTIALGEQIVIWESGSVGGVVAYGVVTELPTPRRAVSRPQLLGDELWAAEIPAPDSPVVGLRILATVHTGFFVGRDVARQHPDLATLDVIRMPQGTVYQLMPAQLVAVLEVSEENED